MKIKQPLLVNAKEMEHQYPDTFHRDNIEEIKIGSSVKIAIEGERFWVTVKSRNDNVLTGIVDNHLFTEQLKYGDTIQFHIDNVYNVL